MAHTPLGGMPVRSTLLGAVSSFQVESARFTAWNGSRATNWPWPSLVFTAPSSGAFELVFRTTFGDRVAVLIDHVRIIGIP